MLKFKLISDVTYSHLKVAGGTQPEQCLDPYSQHCLARSQPLSSRLPVDFLTSISEPRGSTQVTPSHGFTAVVVNTLLRPCMSFKELSALLIAVLVAHLCSVITFVHGLGKFEIAHGGVAVHWLQISPHNKKGSSFDPVETCVDSCVCKLKGSWHFFVGPKTDWCLSVVLKKWMWGWCALISVMYQNVSFMMFSFLLLHIIFFQYLIHCVLLEITDGCICNCNS